MMTAGTAIKHTHDATRQPPNAESSSRPDPSRRGAAGRGERAAWEAETAAAKPWRPATADARRPGAQPVKPRCRPSSRPAPACEDGHRRGLVQRLRCSDCTHCAPAATPYDGPWETARPPATGGRDRASSAPRSRVPSRHCADLAAKAASDATASSAARASSARATCCSRCRPSWCRHRLAIVFFSAVPAAHTADGRRICRHRRRLASRPSSSSNYGGSSGRSSAACAARPSRRGRRAGRRVGCRRRRGRRAGPSARPAAIRRQRRRLGHRGAGAEQPGVGGDRRSSSAEGSSRLGPSALPRDGSRKLFTQALEDSYRSSVAAKRSEGSSPERWFVGVQ